jgi:hypothetical protein
MYPAIAGRVQFRSNPATPSREPPRPKMKMQRRTDSHQVTEIKGLSS